MNCGNLSCPKCGELRMDNFDHWESRTNAYGQIQWLFYRTIVIKKGWRCWALLSSCSKKLPKSWYDPCGLCFNPCKYDLPRRKIVRRDMFGNEQVVSDDSCFVCFCVIFKCIFLYILCYLTYFFYFSIFIWYDIYFCIFKEKVFYDIYTPNGIVKIRETDEIGKWYNIPNVGLTEEYWNTFGLNIFRCNKCGFISNSFHDFIENERNEVIIHNNNRNVESNINFNDINIPYENNLQGEVIETNNLHGESIKVNNLQGETLEVNNLQVEVIEGNNLKGEAIEANNLKGEVIEANNSQCEAIEAINVHFISEDKSINQFISSSSKELFSNVLEKLFGIYPDLRNKVCIFICNGKGMKPNLTLEKNNYKSGDEILIMIRG